MVYRRASDRPLLTKNALTRRCAGADKMATGATPLAPSITVATCAGIGQHLVPAISSVSVIPSTSRSETG